MPTQSVQLHIAFTWTCDHCGKDNFERSVVFRPEMMASCKPDNETKQEMERLREAGIDSSGEWVTKPERVTCGHCGGQFEVSDE